ncbi:hypothetical protein F4781DRAFT_407885 [Annulohypoxylon bovei var. microspora]|nr:hypothetical protein F4781DRAFT_407885 [Annulohypoxylon bovei var. microspora]
MFFDESAKRRHTWAVEDGKVNMAIGQMVYCAEEFVARAGYEKGTPVKESPILLVVPTMNLRPTDQSQAPATIDTAAISSPPTQTFQSKLERFRSRKQSGQGAGSKQGGSSGPSGSMGASVTLL